MYASMDPGTVDSNWTLVAWMSFGFAGDSVTAAELEAAASVVTFLDAYFKGYNKASHAMQRITSMDYQIVNKLSLATVV